MHLDARMLKLAALVAFALAVVRLVPQLDLVPLGLALWLAAELAPPSEPTPKK